MGRGGGRGSRWGPAWCQDSEARATLVPSRLHLGEDRGKEQRTTYNYGTDLSCGVWKQDKEASRYAADSVSETGVPKELPSEKVLRAGVGAAVGGPPAAARRGALGLG